MDTNPWTKNRQERQERLREMAERTYQELETLLPKLASGDIPDDQDVIKFQNRLKGLHDSVRIYLVLRARERGEQ